jgi:hypothetical protein
VAALPNESKNAGHQGSLGRPLKSILDSDFAARTQVNIITAKVTERSVKLGAFKGCFGTVRARFSSHAH